MVRNDIADSNMITDIFEGLKVGTETTKLLPPPPPHDHKYLPLRFLEIQDPSTQVLQKIEEKRNRKRKNHKNTLRDKLNLVPNRIGQGTNPSYERMSNLMELLRNVIPKEYSRDDAEENPYIGMSLLALRSKMAKEKRVHARYFMQLDFDPRVEEKKLKWYYMILL